MLKTAFALLTAGVILVVIGMAGTDVVTVPLPGRWWMKFFPTGIGVLVLVGAACLFGVVALRRGSADSPDADARDSD
jgi:hypothetical protein